MIPALAMLVAYLLGAIPFGYLLVKWKSGRDVRTVGSGNIGATNVLRTTSRSLGILTLLLDIGKGALAVWVASLLTGGSPLWTSAAALAVMLGHAFPVFLKFRGGKAVASFVGAFLYLEPLPLAAALLLFLLVVWWTRYISLGSILAAAALPLAAWAINHPPASALIATVLASAVVILRHHQNIARLAAGKEHKLNLGGSKS